jgi:predicted acetyltransferase
MDADRTISLEIRAPRREEFHDIVAIADLGFGEETSREDELALSETFPWDRALCAYDAGLMVGTLVVFSKELTLPGRRSLPAGAASWGGTLPTHRRRGVLSALFRAQLSDMSDRGEPLAVLMASEGSIYRRFGFGPATTIASFSIERAYAGFVPPVASAAAQGITLVSDIDAAGRLPAVYESLRLDQPGALSRSPKWWAHYLRDPLVERQGATKMYHAVHTGAAGRPDGYVSYRIKEQWSASTPVYDVIVVELLAADRDAYKALWHYVINTDLCQTVSCWRGRSDEPLRWMLADPRRLAVNAFADDLYVRLLDIPRALAGREYATHGSLVLEVSENFPTPRSTRYWLQSGGPGQAAECRATDAGPDIRMDVDALAMAYLGGVTFTRLATAGRVESREPGALASADAMFSSGISPYCCTMF